ncbi:hypothetical protein AGMMS50262_10950 [Bacteroidia bacterium]|nr:hypothetical protein AGMMS50262_10950 [Bacteroidia bacterium]
MLNLKKLLVIPALAGLFVMAYTPDSIAQEVKKEKVVTVDKTVHDFGTVSEDGGNISTVFIVTNNTNAPIVITGVRASCGCTTPEWTKEPIAPGKTGEVKATYSPKGRPGPFEKTVTITTDGDPDRIVVKIKGVVES